MSMFTDKANVSAIGRINKHSFWLAAAGYLCVNFEIWGAGSELSKRKRHRDECVFIRHRYYYLLLVSLLSLLVSLIVVLLVLVLVLVLYAIVISSIISIICY